MKNRGTDYRKISILLVLIGIFLAIAGCVIFLAFHKNFGNVILVIGIVCELFAGCISLKK